MAAATEAVRIGLSDLHYALLKSDTTAGLEYDEIKPIAPAVSATVTPNQDSSSFFADDRALITTNTLADISVELETADIPQEVLAELTGSKLDEKGVVVDSALDTPPYVALLFKSKKSSGKYKYYVLYKGAFGFPESEFATQEDSAEYQTETIAATFVPTVFDGRFRATADEENEGSEEVTKTWLTEVYGSKAAPGGGETKKLVK